MSMMRTIESGDGWELDEDMMMDNVLITVRGATANYQAGTQWCRVQIPTEMIDAIRAIQPRFLPHLRKQRAAIFSERSRKGWQTRRNEGRAQQDADIKTLIGFPADAPKSVTMIRGTE